MTAQRRGLPLIARQGKNHPLRDRLRAHHAPRQRARRAKLGVGALRAYDLSAAKGERHDRTGDGTDDCHGPQGLPWMFTDVEVCGIGELPDTIAAGRT